MSGAERIVPILVSILLFGYFAGALNAAPALGTGASASNSPLDQPQPISDDDLVILEVNSSGTILSDGIGAYASRTGIYLPLGELARLLELSIVIEPPVRKSTGWVLSPNRGFEIDLKTRIARSGDIVINLAPADVVLKNDEMLVRAELLSRLLPATFKPDIRNLALTIIPREPLPFQQRGERELRRIGIGPEQTEAPAASIYTPYLLFSMPSIDVQFDGSVTNSSPKSQYRYDMRLAGDLLYSGMQFFAASDNKAKLNDIRLVFERKDPDGKIAGPFGMTKISVGDTFTPGLSIGAQSTSGRGFAIGNEPLEQASVFNRTDFRGELPLGFEVELYVNEVLRGSQGTPVNGRYDFSEVPLTYGINNVRLIFYGPRGERREEVRRLNVGGGQISPGETQFSLGAVEQGAPLIRVGSAKNTIFGPTYGKLQITGRVAHGLTPATTLVAGFAHYTPGLGDSRRMGMIGLRASIFSLASQFDIAADSKGGKSLGIGVAGRLGPASFLLRQNEYHNGFVDNALSGAGGENLKRSTDGRIDLNIQLGKRSLPLAFSFRRDEQTNGLTIIRSDGRLSTAISSYFVSTSLNLQRTSGPGASQTIAQGSTELSGIIPLKWQLRSGLIYDVAPKARVTDGFLTADRAISDRAALRFGASHHFGQPATTTFLAGMTFRLPIADISLNAGYTTRPRDIRFGIQLALGSAYNPITKRYQLTRPGVTNGGAIAMSAMIEGAGDDSRPSRTPVANMQISGSGFPAKTDSHGIALVSGLGNGSRARIEADLSSVDDPFLTVDEHRFVTVPRPGRVAVAHMVFAASGEVMLKLKFDDGSGNLRGLSALKLQLIGKNDEVIKEGRTEFDGSLLLEGLRPGNYTLRIDPDQASRLNLFLTNSPIVKIDPAGGYAGEVTTIVTSKSVSLMGASDKLKKE